MVLCVVPIMKVFAEASSGGAADSGSGATGSGSSGSKLPGDAVAGVRLTVIDRYGKIVSGTETVDFVNKSDVSRVKSNSVYKNSSKNRHKGGVIDGNLSWKTDANLKVVASPVTITFNSKDHIKLNNKTMINYLGGLAKTDTLYNKWIKQTGYDRSGIDFNQHYIIVEPTIEVQADGKWYYGTATEIAKLVRSSKCSGPVTEGHCRYTLDNVATDYVGPSACYDGEFSRAGSKNNGVTLAAENTLVGYISSNSYTSGPRFEYSCSQSFDRNENLYQKKSGKYNGNGVIVFYLAAMLKEQCDINNPEHFHVVDGSEEQDYKSNDKTSTCCDEMIAKYGEEYVVSRYPICGACEVKTDEDTDDCDNGSTAALTLTDVSNKDDLNAKFKCLYQGVSGKGANKYDYSARESVRQKYKVTSVNEYCEVYCIDDIVANFPGNFLGIVAPGGTFQWPSYNDDYEATVTRTRTCKIRFRQQEWLSAFNSGNKTTLLEKLKTCANSTMETVTTNYKKVKNPSLSVSYNNGATKIGPKTLKVSEKESSLASTCSNCSVNTSNITTSNVVSQLNNLATQIGNKVLTITQNLKYVLPDGLYQYVDNNQGGKYLENYNGSSSAKKTDSSNLLVSENAKPGQKYDLTIEYNSMSPVGNKFDKTSGKYECNYTPDKSSLPNTCDVNEINHFKDLNGDGKLDSGPNGEDCCEWVADKFGKDSDTYQKLVEKGLCPVTPPGDPDDPDSGSGCSYPDDLASADFETKKKCCSMILVDQSTSLSEEDRKKFYQEYCDNGGNGDPYCPQDCEDGVCHDSPMTQNLRNCMNGGKSYNECKVDNCPGGGSIVIYRPISLLYEEAFPGVEDENRIVSNNNWYYYSNWAYRGGGTKLKDYYVDRDITNNRGVEEYKLYDMDPMYVIDMDADTIGKIRIYNRTHSYDDFTLECEDGRQCKSTFLRHSDITSKISGCGMSNNWYACQGISKDRGD